MSMSQAYGRPDRAESERALARALDVGIDFFDTASVYGLGHNETLLGQVRSLAPSRLTTFPLVMQSSVVQSLRSQAAELEAE